VLQTATCENGAAAPGRDETVQGTSLLARRGASDFVLCPRPPGAVKHP
jgi:hypothetical protein